MKNLLILLLLLSSLAVAEIGYVSTIYDLFVIGEAANRDGDFVLMNDIDLSYTKGLTAPYWEPEHYYAIGDIVRQHGFYFYCIASHTSIEMEIWEQDKEYEEDDDIVYSAEEGYIGPWVCDNELGIDGWDYPFAYQYDEGCWDEFSVLFNDAVESLSWIEVGSAISGWRGFGDAFGEFTGTFDGQGKTISNLKQVNPRGANSGSQNSGLFGTCSGATIKNLTLTDVAITDNEPAVGGLAAIVTSSAVTNCHVIGGTVGQTGVSKFSLGGFVGFVNTASTVTRCSSQGLIVETDATTASNAGGFACNIQQGSVVSQCFSTSTVIADNSANARAGGFVEAINAATVRNCYAIGGTITATTGSSGGFCGRTVGAANISNCYSANVIVAGSGTNGGFLGLKSAESTVSNNYYDATVDLVNEVADVAGITGKTTAQMKNRLTYEPAWDFESIWYIGTLNSGYPYFYVVRDSFYIGAYQDMYSGFYKGMY